MDNFSLSCRIGFVSGIVLFTAPSSHTVSNRCCNSRKIHKHHSVSGASRSPIQNTTAASASSNDSLEVDSTNAQSTAFPGPLAAAALQPASSIWELDFYSRPVLGPDGKKRWELLIVDRDGIMEHIEEIPSSKVNSGELRERVRKVIDSAVVRPTEIRFFRAAMQNMISIGLSGLDVQVKPSRRTYRLRSLLEEREKNVYPNMPGYKKELKPDRRILNVRVGEKMPDALRGDRYAFVSLPLEALQEAIEDPPAFGDICPIDREQLGLSDESLISGVLMFSKRAKPLSAWLTGLEMASLVADLDKRDILLDCDLSTSYLFGKIVGDQVEEARNFEKLKKKNSGLHFIGVCANESADEIEGFWLMRELGM
mmetsp:Transcript_3169/g.5583  ORF Transcript_3169/g.5583 Transcript_3169/m.5583 type:complete len:368 (-) Transcript_3169:166-1269(-)